MRFTSPQPTTTILSSQAVCPQNPPPFDRPQRVCTPQNRQSPASPSRRFGAQHRADRFHRQQNTLPLTSLFANQVHGHFTTASPVAKPNTIYRATMGNLVFGKPAPAHFSKCFALPTSTRLNQPAIISPAASPLQNRSASPFPPVPQPSTRLCFHFLVPNVGVSGTACLSRTMAGNATLP